VILTRLRPRRTAKRWRRERRPMPGGLLIPSFGPRNGRDDQLLICHVPENKTRTATVMTSDARIGLMSRVRTKDTAPEMAVRRALFRRRLRFRVHNVRLPGTPDVVLSDRRLAIFVHGCFWHGCTQCDRGLRRPKSNSAFWDAKLVANRDRDARSAKALRALGWQVAIVWECATWNCRTGEFYDRGYFRRAWRV
jgi:DNA mismatch endonuclease (patch repair protein)